jgi:tripartite-type tricarboxylate transporter receptor subunit TctC
MTCRALAIGISGSLLWTAGAAAESVEDFYRGKTITVYVASNIGGGYAIYGNPAVVPSYMPGGGGLAASNYLFNAARKDGTALGVLFAQTQLVQFLNPKAVKYDAVKFNWIGIYANIIQALHVSKKAKATTLDALKATEIITGSSGVNSGTYLFPKLVNDTLGTKMKYVFGYPGTGALNLAMERGEIDAFTSPWGSVTGSMPQLLTTANQVVQYGYEKSKDFPGVPLLTDLVQDPVQRQMVRFTTGPSVIGRSLAAPPDVPKERVDTLRRAFDAMLADPDFLTDVKKGKTDLSPKPGVEAQAIIAELAKVDPKALELARAAFPQ